MPLDANGIWQFEETDPASPISGTLNLLAGSVSAEIATLKAAAGVPDTGWLPLTLDGDWVTDGSTAPAARRIGDAVALRGAAAGSSIDLAQLPDDRFWPTSTLRFIVPPNSNSSPSTSGSSSIAQIAIFTDGFMTQYSSGATTLHFAGCHYMR